MTNIVTDTPDAKDAIASIDAVTDIFKAQQRAMRLERERAIAAMPPAIRAEFKRGAALYEAVSQDDHYLECSGCDAWFHTECDQSVQDSEGERYCSGDCLENAGTWSALYLRQHEGTR